MGLSFVFFIMLIVFKKLDIVFLTVAFLALRVFTSYLTYSKNVTTSK